MDCWLRREVATAELFLFPCSHNPRATEMGSPKEVQEAEDINTKVLSRVVLGMAGSMVDMVLGLMGKDMV